MLPAVLVHLALCVSVADAFFAWCPPYLPCETGTGRRAVSGESTHGFEGLTVKLSQRRPDTSPDAEIAEREARRLAKKFSRIQPPESRAAIDRRDNEYDVDLPIEPTQDLTAGIAQDGTDFSYFAEARFGSEGTPMYMLTDTGAGTSWVMGSSCTSDGCSRHNSFGADDSDTFEATDKEFSIGYSTGSVRGTLATDKVSFAGMDLDLEFGVANYVSNEFTHFPFDGILGLARNGGKTFGFLNTIEASGVLEKNMFAVYLNRARDGTNTGELNFGALNPAKYTGEVSYTPLVDQDGDWIINMDKLSYGDEKASGKMKAYVDTGTTYMFGPPEVVYGFHQLIPGAQSTDNVTYTVPCDTDSLPVLTFSGVDWQISREDWLSSPNSGVCTSNIYGIAVVANSWLLGGTFLKNVYAVFDDEEARIGFAQRVNPAPPPPPPPTTTKQANSPSQTPTTEPSESEPEPEPTETSSSDSERDTELTDGTTFTTRPTSVQTSRPSLGLSGPETPIPTTGGTAAAQTDTPTSTENASPPDQRNGAVYASIVCIVTWLAVLA